MAWIALLKYFHLKTTSKQPLPNPNGELSSKIPVSGISSANACIGKLLNSMLSSADTHGPYYKLRSLKLERKLLKKQKPACSDVILSHPFNGYTKVSLILPISLSQLIASTLNTGSTLVLVDCMLCT